MVLTGWTPPTILTSPITQSREIERLAERLDGVALAQVRVDADGLELVCTGGRLAGTVLVEAADLDGLLELVEELTLLASA